MFTLNLGGRYSVWGRPYDVRYTSHTDKLFFRVEIDEATAHEYMARRFDGVFVHETPVLFKLFEAKATEQFKEAMRNDREIYKQYRGRTWTIEPKQLILFPISEIKPIELAAFAILSARTGNFKEVRQNREYIRQQIVLTYPNLHGVRNET